MANKLKQNATGTEADSIFKGDWAINTTEPNIGGGPSHSTGFYTGAHIPEDGYVIYYLNEAYAAINDTDLLGRVKGLGGDSSSVSAALAWAATEPSIVILNKAFNNKVTDGLVLKLDSNNISSFVDSQPTTNHTHDTPSQGGWGGSYNVLDSSVKKFRFNVSNFNGPAGSGQGWRAFTWDLREYAGYSVTISATVEVPAASPGTFAWIKMGQTNTHTSNGSGIGMYMGYSAVSEHIHKNTKTKERISWSGILGNSGVAQQPSGNVGFTVWYNGGTPGINSYVEVSNVQIELNAIATPFVNGTRIQNTDMHDLSKSNNHGVLLNSTTFYRDAISFDGMDDKIAIPNPLSHQKNLDQEWTVMACVNVGSKTFQKLVGGLNQGVYVVYTSDRSLLYLNGGVNDYYTYGHDLSDVGWEMVTFRFRNSDGYRTIWKNGINRTTSGPNKTSTPSGMGETLYIGEDMQGYLSNISIYDRVLSDAEVLHNYYQAPIITGGLVYAIDAGNLVSYEEPFTVANNLAGDSGAFLENSVGFDKNNRGSWVLDGVDASINLGNPSVARNSEFSVCFFYNPSTVQNQTHNGIINGITPNGRFCLFWYAGNRVSVQYRDNSGLSAASGGVWQRASAPSTLSADNWYFIQITGNENTGEFKCGVNLIESPVSNSSQYVDPDANDWVIGRRAGTAHDHAKVTNLLIYDRILTTEELAQNFNAQRNRFGI